MVSMPLRAFLLFGPNPAVAAWFQQHARVSMPLRAFLLFGRTKVAAKTLAYLGFNALAGIFAFRTQTKCHQS